MADIKAILAQFAAEHPEAAADVSKVTADLAAAAVPAVEQTAEAAAAAEIRSGGFGALVHRIAKAVLGPLSGPEQDAVAEVCGAAPAQPAPKE